jgi:hypothetical protein
MTLRGSCLCGGMRYEITGPLMGALNCHCSMCRKAQGSAFRTRAAVRRADFRWTEGEELLQGYGSSPGTTRTFCRVCGSTMISIFESSPEVYGLALGTLDDDPGVRPAFHVFVGSKAPWHEITDDLPQYDTLPPAP